MREGDEGDHLKMSRKNNLEFTVKGRDWKGLEEQQVDLVISVALGVCGVRDVKRGVPIPRGPEHVIDSRCTHLNKQRNTEQRKT